MRATNRNESIILAIAGNNSDITIRIDKNGWANGQLEGLPVVELRLMSCGDVVRVLDKLTNSIDQPLYYEVVKEDTEITVLLWVNYSPDQLEIKCTHVNEVTLDYTFEDWKRKASRLAELYLASAEMHELSDYMYSLLRDTLAKMIGKELDRSQHKIDFLSRTNPEEAATLTGQVQAYRKVLTLIGLGEVDGLSIASQIAERVSRIWDDHIENQVAYAKSVESSIADLGEAAIFPLLELLSHPDPSVRAEVMHILSLIDPKVKQAIQDIVGSTN